MDLIHRRHSCDELTKMSVELSLEASVGAGVRVEGVAVTRPPGVQVIQTLLPQRGEAVTSQVILGSLWRQAG